MSNLVFERATEEDANILVMFEKKVASPKLYGNPLDLMGAVYAILDYNFYFIKIIDEVVGTGAYKVREDGSCHISNIAVTPEWRAKGIARAAMNFLMEKCSQTRQIDLVTHPDNFRAISLYQSLGFLIEAHIEKYYGDGEPRLVMAKRSVGKAV